MFIAADIATQLGRARTLGGLIMRTATADEEDIMRTGVRVLVVDDDFGFRNAIADALEHLGWHVRGAATGADALGVLRSWRPNVILLDLMLPVMDGWSFRAEADRQHALEDIPIVVTSGVANARREAEKLQAAAALSKPFELDELVRIVQGLVAPEGQADLAG
jgi:two-component system, chemotaxis family, chemotaxis protein CheY